MHVMLRILGNTQRMPFQWLLPLPTTALPFLICFPYCNLLVIFVVNRCFGNKFHFHFKCQIWVQLPWESMGQAAKTPVVQTPEKLRVFLGAQLKQIFDLSELWRSCSSACTAVKSPASCGVRGGGTRGAAALADDKFQATGAASGRGPDRDVRAGASFLAATPILNVVLKKPQIMHTHDACVYGMFESSRKQ